MEFAEIQKAIEALPLERRRALLKWLQDRQRSERRAARPAKRPVTTGQAVWWTLLSLAAFFLVDGAIFRSGWYLKYLQPDSTTGQLEMHLFWLRHEFPTKEPEAAVIGDSRVAEGFAARKAGQSVGGRIHFWNLGVAGSTPRTWFYILRDADPERRRFAAIVVAMDRYSDEDGWEDPSNRVSDLNYAVGRLRLTDCLDFSRSYRWPELRRAALTGCIFKAVTLRRDVQDLLANRAERLKLAKAWRNEGHGYIDGYGGKPEDLTGLTADLAAHSLHFPAGAKAWQTESVRSILLSAPAPQTGALTEYRKLWLGRILQMYRDSQTRIIFLELPGGPIARPEPKTPARFLRSIAGRSRVTILPGDMFRDLEHPEVYADGLHLNHVGRPIFSERVGQKVADALEIR